MNKYRNKLERNHLLEFLARFPDAEWHTGELLYNPNMTSAYVKAHPEIRWDWGYYLTRKGLGNEFRMPQVEKRENTGTTFLDIVESGVDYYRLLDAPPITLSDVKMRPAYEWNYGWLSQTLNITMADVLANPDFPWKYQNLSLNPGITFADMKAHRYANGKCKWDGAWYSVNPSVTMRDVLANPDWHWHYEQLSLNASVTMSDVDKSKEAGQPHDSNWYYPRISRNINLTMRYVLDNLEEDWDYRGLASNPAISIEDILEHPELPWSYGYIQYNSNLTVEDMEWIPEIPHPPRCAHILFTKDPPVHARLTRLAAEEDVRIAELLLWLIPDICRVVLAYN